MISDTLRAAGRLCIVLSLVQAAFSHADWATYFVILGAVLLWQGGFDFGNMSQRYH